MGVGEKLRRIKVVASDVDGTLTVSRSNYRIDLDAIKAIRLLEEKHIKIILVSGNALPVVLGLARYLGTSGPVVSENGCIIGYRGQVVRVCRRSTKEAMKLVAEYYRDILVESWQNMYREYDFAFHIRSDKYKHRQGELVEDMEKLLRENNYEWVKVVTSGFAIHIRPVDSDKGVGLLRALEILGVKPDETAGIGDGANDIELLRVVGLAVAVANADPVLIRHADIVLSRPSGKGFAELAEMILEAKRG